MRNALSVDVEDWFQVGAFETVISREAWERLPARVERNTDAVLALFEEAGVKATFFTLGWIAKRHPALICRIAERGHEIASHGWDHKRVFTLSEAEFRDDLIRARGAIEDSVGQTPVGYRAPSFSVDARTPGRTSAGRPGYTSKLGRSSHPYGWARRHACALRR